MRFRPVGLPIFMLFLNACYLTSPKPEGKALEVSTRDKAFSANIEEIMLSASQMLRDMHKLTSFSLGANLPAGTKSESITDLPEYITLFDPVEPGSLIWQSTDPRRFSRAIWNEATYIMQRQNPAFQFRVEGRLDSNLASPEAIVFSIDTNSVVNAKNSDAILSARKICGENDCSYRIRIDHKAIAKNFSALGTKSTWAGSSGILSATVTTTTTSATFADFSVQGDVQIPILGTRRVSLAFTKINYNRTRGTDVSLIEAEGTLSVEGQTPRKFLLSGNLRKASSLVFKKTSGAL